jgi:hypothetical protein
MKDGRENSRPQARQNIKQDRGRLRPPLGFYCYQT